MKKQFYSIDFSVVSGKAPSKEYATVSFVEALVDEVHVKEDGSKTLLLAMGPSPLTRRSRISLIRRIVTFAKSHRIGKIALELEGLLGVKHSDEILLSELAEQVATNMEMANFEFNDLKTPPKHGWSRVEEVVLFVPKKDLAEIKKACERGVLIGREVNECRRLANTPGSDMTPSILVDRATEILKGTKVAIKALVEKEMEKLGMGGVLGVGQGSDEKPRFVIMEYFAGPKGDKPLVLVGKGVTFDTGGLNLKPSDGIYEMHMDMSGGAAVISAIAAAAKLGLKKNVVGLIPAVENMPSGSSYRPGDVLRTMNGKTIEVLNTDAEGRIILADALEYAKKYTPRLVVDVATLTGAAMVALGNRASAIFTKDIELEKLFRDLGEESGDYVWPLPLWSEFEREVKGTFGDYANLGKSGRAGGAITGATFLYQFVKNEDGAAAYPWVHIDMAPRMTSAEGDHLAKGAAGEPVRLLIKLIEQF